MVGTPGHNIIKAANNLGRRRCKVCSEKSAYKCQQCDAFVCFGEGGTGTCFWRMHNVSGAAMINPRMKKTVTK